MSVVLGPLAEDAFLDEHREPGRAQGLLQALAVLEISVLVPGHVDHAVGVAVHRERGGMDVNRPGLGAEPCPGRRSRAMAEGRHAERETGDRRGGPGGQAGQDGWPPNGRPLLRARRDSARCVTTLTSSASSRPSKPPSGRRTLLTFMT